jgi:2-methylisocitrate lyase-like PEP mutase family enzyme
MPSRTERAERFLALHCPGRPLLLPNPWDPGSAKLLASLGFEALATTSSGHAGTLGLADGAAGKDAALSHAASIAAATELPVTADLEDGFGERPEEVAATLRAAAQTGVAGCSIEDFSATPEPGILPLALAAERIAAAAEVAGREATRLVLTARAENHLHGRDDLGDTITRLQAYQEVGADVLYAPGLSDPSQIAQVVRNVDRPLNVLARRHGPSLAELASLGVARISLGGALHALALAAVARAARSWLDDGRHDFLAEAAVGVELRRRLFR